MNIVRHHPRSFVERAVPFLEHHEAVHHLMVGLALSLEKGDMTLNAPPLLVTVESDDGVVAAALRTPPLPLWVSLGDSDALGALADYLVAEGLVPKELCGPRASAEQVARLVANDRATLGLRERVFACEQVAAELQTSSGRMRSAAGGDVRRLQAWIAKIEKVSEPRAEALLARYLEAESLHVWDDGELVAMVRVADPTRRGIRIADIYTSPPHRGRGYATSLLAAVTRQRLAEGTARCFMHLAVDAPDQGCLRMGYQPVGESDTWRL